jgi:hypothetical protein
MLAPFINLNPNVELPEFNALHLVALQFRTWLPHYAFGRTSINPSVSCNALIEPVDSERMAGHLNPLLSDVLC